MGKMTLPWGWRVGYQEELRCAGRESGGKYWKELWEQLNKQIPFANSSNLYQKVRSKHWHAKFWSQDTVVFTLSGEILESLESKNSTTTCWLDINSEGFTAYCSRDLVEFASNYRPGVRVYKTAAIKCKQTSNSHPYYYINQQSKLLSSGQFSPEMIVLTTLVPVLIAIILVWALVHIHLTIKLNANKQVNKNKQT